MNPIELEASGPRMAAHGGTGPEAASPARAASLLFAAAVVLALIFLALQARHYWPFIADDAFISLRYSQRLMHGKGLTWTGGRPVEGYSNLLWVLLCAGLGSLGMDLVLAARLLGIVSVLAAFASIAVYIRIALPLERRPLAAACALFSFALSSPVAVWAIGGLEQGLVIALLGWALIGVTLFLRRGRTAPLLCTGVLLAAITLTRADGFVFPLLLFAGLAAGLAAAHAQRLKIAPALAVLAPSAVAYIAQLLFRLRYYGEWLPNTAYVKVSFTLHRLFTGFRYVAAASLEEASLLLLGAAGCFFMWRSPARHALAGVLLIIGIGFSLYLVLIGGDIFPAARHFLPVILVLCFAAAHASQLAERPGGRTAPRPCLALVALALLAILSRRQAVGAEWERWEWQNKFVGLYIKQHFPANALVASDAAGAIPFYSERDAIDPLGLNDYHIAHLRSADRGEGKIGHELGDGSYVLDHEPAVIVFASGGADPGATSDYQILADPRFKQLYELQRWTFDVPPDHWVTEIYVRRPRP
jgi:hypothetical protein